MASEQQFCLRWNNHQSTLVAVFDTLLESGTLVDCTLAAEGQYLKAHKVVLSACSPYFELLLSQHNEKHPIVILKDVKFQELKAMMDYMYRGEVNISQDQLGALLKAAESLQIKGLSDSGGGNERESSDRRHSRKEAPPPQPPPARSPPASHTSGGLTIEHRRSTQAAPPVVELPEDSPPSGGTPHIGGSREGSVSPIPRKRKRHRRRSSTEDATQGLLPMTDSHDQTSSSCELPPQSQPAPATNIPAIISPVVPTPAISRAASDPISSVGPDEQTDELKRSSLPPQPNLSVEGLPPDPEPIQKLEPPSEMLLEPKSEYLDDTMNEDSVENLTTLDDVDDMDDARPGPSHGGEGSSNQGSGFAPWHVRAADRTTDEVFMAAQEVVGAHRDSQGAVSAAATAVSASSASLVSTASAPPSAPATPAPQWDEGLPVEVQLSEAPEEPFVCGACGRRFRQVHSLRDHWNSACGKASGRSTAPSLAAAAPAPGPVRAPTPPPAPLAPASTPLAADALPHRCPGCGRGYKWATSLRDHWNAVCGRGGVAAAASLAATGTSRLPFICPACGQGHPDEPALRHHLAVACAGRAGAALPCPLCGRRCETVRALCQHLAAECEARGAARGPLPCPACGQPCAELRAHLEGNCTQRPQFWCPRCPYSSVQLGSLRRHARARHGCDL